MDQFQSNQKTFESIKELYMEDSSGSPRRLTQRRRFSETYICKYMASLLLNVLLASFYAVILSVAHPPCWTE